MQSATIEDSDEQQLARQAIAGDRSALRTLIVRLDPMLRGFLRKLAGQDGEDLAQETWIRVQRAIASFDGSHFRAWVFQIARNLVKDQGRKKKAQQLPEQYEAEDRPDQPLPDDDDCHRLKRCLEALEPVFRFAISLWANGESYEAIAKQQETNTNTVSTRINRAKEKLSRCMGNQS